MKQAYEILKKVFGYEEFKEHQKEIIENVINRKNVVAIMPTGSGKSLCYQIPALIFDGLTIVVSPLISLMKDQVLQLNQNGVKAIFLNSSLPWQEYEDNVELILNRKVKLLYAAPETLVSERIINILKQVEIDLIAVDEAHCISEWGHDFRPEYRKLTEFRKNFPKATTIALTATATPQVQKEIFKNLEIRNAKLFISSFDRKNLTLEVVPKQNSLSQTIEFIDKFKNQSGLIYCFSRKQVDNLSENLKKLGYSVLPYHAGLTDEERIRNQEAFIKDDVNIIVATVAFGMGINKPDIRFVLHHDLPKNIENYYQQIGRAGRDGLDSFCRLLFSYGDIVKIKYLLKDKDEMEKIKGLRMLNSIVDFCETEDCRRKPLLNYFGEKYPNENCGKCDNCLNPKINKEDLTIEAQKYLSCIKRTGEMFGNFHIIKVLRGSKDKNVLQRKHNELSTYGIGSDLSKKQWNHLIRQFTRKGLIDIGEFGVPKLNAESWKILRGQEKFLGTLIEEKSKVVFDKDVNYDKKLFAILKNLRKQIADEQNVPPYIVFTDRTLIDICTYYPQNKESLLSMNGLGEKKIEQYGSILIKYISDYAQKSSKEDISIRKLIIKRKSSSTKKYLEVGQKFNSGMSISEISAEDNVLESTIIQHLIRFKNEGNTLNRKIAVDLPPEIIENIEKALSKSQDGRLKPIFEKFDGKYSYDTIKKILLNF